VGVAADYAVKIAGKAEKQLAKLPKDVRRLVADAIDDLGHNPFPPGSKALKGGHVEDMHRVRIGSYRVAYEVWRKEVIVLVLKVGHRRDVYR
jgi:mRNA interferase RelE/StbE